ncbi:Eaa1 [Klebsiella oxytoca]|nr:Eaa1 [Klebsiella oxytoca]
MTNNQLTREKVQWLHDAAEEAAAVGIKLTMNPSELLMFTSSLLAEMDTEPVAKQVACWSCRSKVEISAIGDCDGYCPNCNSSIDLDEEPYTAPQSAPDRDQVRREHAEWSQATFGNVGPIGPLKHLRKEALEAIAKPQDLIEWADMQFLLWDAQRRAGITDEQITQAMIEKLEVNKQREWPEPKDGEPRLHIKEHPAPVMPNFKKLARELVDNLVDCGGLDEGVKEKYLKWTEKTCRAAMLNGGKP